MEATQDITVFWQISTMSMRVSFVFYKHHGLVFIKIRMWTQCNVRNASRSYWIQSDFK